MGAESLIPTREPGRGVRALGIACACLATLTALNAPGSFALGPVLGTVALVFEALGFVSLAGLAVRLLTVRWEVVIDLRDRLVTRRGASIRTLWFDRFPLDAFEAVELRNVVLGDAPADFFTAWLVGPEAALDLFEPDDLPNAVIFGLLRAGRAGDRPTRRRLAESVAARSGLIFRDASRVVAPWPLPGDRIDPVPSIGTADSLEIRRQPVAIRLLGWFLALDSTFLGAIGLSRLLGLGPASPWKDSLSLLVLSIPCALAGLAMLSHRDAILLDRRTRTLTRNSHLLGRRRTINYSFDDFSEVYLRSLTIPGFPRPRLSVDLIAPGVSLDLFDRRFLPRSLVPHLGRLPADDRLLASARALASFCSLPIRVAPTRAANPIP